MKFLRKLFMLISKYTWRLFIIQVICMNLGFAADISSQSFEKVKVSLSLKDADLATVFRTLEKKTDFVFAYSGQLDISGTFDLHYKNATLRRVLEDLAKEASIEFRCVNKTISVTAREVKAVKPPPLAINVRGQVKDNEGVPLPGVNVLEKGTTNGTSTDAEGNYSLDVASESSVLVFSFIGYSSQEITVGSQTSINVQLEADVTTIQEVVVIGYGEQEKKDLTGAISVIDNKDMSKMQATTVAEAIQGLAPGVNVRNSGRAGSESTIEIRGLGNFSNNQPLYVIDGIPTIATRDFNASDVESIQILKDASAAAIYGSRAANGVIIITTKKGKSGPMKVDVSGRFGVQALPRYEFMSASDFKKYNTMAYQEAIEVEKFPWIIAQGYQQYADGIDTDWQEETFRTAQTHDYNLTFSGGNEFGTYLVSGNYFGNTGTSFGSSFDRYSFRVNTEGKRGRFKIGENLSIARGFSEDLITNPFWDMLRMLPTIPVRDPANPGGFGYGNEAKARTFGVNPIARETLEETTNQNLRFRGNLYAEAELVKQHVLTYRLNVGIEASNENYKYVRRVGNWTLNQPFDPSAVNENRGQYLSSLVENTLHFNKEFDKHKIDVVAGTTFQRQEYKQVWGTKRNLINIGGKYYDVLDGGTTDPESGGFMNEDVLISYLGRVNYSYDDKYYLTGTIRRDGSSRFAKENRWGNFPSVSAGWRISGENFFNVPWIDDLKIRANYGSLGNSSIGRWIGYGGSFYGSSIYNLGNWDYQSLLNATIVSVLGRDQHLVNGATQVKLANSNLRWETKEQINFGADLAFLNSRLALTFEYFISTTKDVLTEMPILMSTGNDGGNPWVNAASIRNKGVEITTTWKDQVQGLKYSITANVSTLRNEVLKLGYGRNDVITWMTRTQIGEPIGMFYLRETNGLFRSAEDVLNHVNSQGKVIQPNAKPGDIRYVDFDDNGEINDADRHIVGNPWPTFDLGLITNFEYKNFDLSLIWYGAFGQDVYNGSRAAVERFDDNSNYFAFKDQKPYQEDPNSNFPRLLYGDDRNARGDTDRWLEDGSYFRMRNVTLGYNLPRAFAERVHLNTARVFVTGQNLVTFTGYTGLDPDFTAPDLWRRGHDEVRYPNARTFLVGLQFNF
ncbi:TonB-dependent receptor [Fulvivirgaceae bacterium PWU4]|uniref:TonB-dependent receptor n=1 Tax=Chryseosolibacter histidini TaxID=2782349 RepID=A0AAP2GHJ5_9BACT|nr:SusC/RagA family TonB-linked outer membrane protein [Chryseosolibacter histidini]MBT1696096.1 TonB-dependent receptor [Chryseosolibacter histidini]